MSNHIKNQNVHLQSMQGFVVCNALFAKPEEVGAARILQRHFPLAT